MNLGDMKLGQTFSLKFCTTAASTGVPTTLSGTPVISAYPANSTTQLTAGITLTADFDSVTGLNNVTVVASTANGYLTGTDYDLVITTGTVGGASAVGYVVGSFSIENRVVNFASVNTPVGPIPALGWIDSGTAQAATGTTLQLRSAAAFTANGDIQGATIVILSATTGAGQSRIINSYVTSTDTATVDAWSTTPTGTIVYAVIPTPPASSVSLPPVNVTSWNGTAVSAPATAGIPDVNMKNVGNQTANAAAAVTFPGSIASPTNITAGTITTATNVTTVNGLAANVITAASAASDFGAEIAAAIWDQATTGHTTTATFGAQLKTVVDTINTTTQAIAGYVDTEVAAIKAKTDFLPSALAGAAGGVFIAGSNADIAVNITGTLTGSVTGSVGSVTNPVAANVTQVRAQPLTGTGTDVDPWRPA